MAIVTSQPHIYAYIDPGSTSMLLQAIIGGVAAVLVITRSAWSRAVRRLGRALGRTPAPAGRADHDPTRDSGV